MPRNKEQRKRIKPIATEPAHFIDGAAKPIGSIKKMMLLIIAVFSFALYANTLTHKYTVDDGTVMQNNKIVKKGVSAIPEIFTTRYREGFWERKENLYRPLSLVMFAIEWQIAPDNPFPGHLTNVLLYMITGIILFATLIKLLPDRNLFLPFMITLLFMAHPLHTEVVANIKSRDEILCFLFIIASINLLISYSKSSKVLSLVFSGFCFFLALLAKENAITYLAIAPLVLHFFTKDKFKKIVRCTAMFVMVTGIYLVLRSAILGGLGGQTELQLVNNSLLGANDATTKFATAMYIMSKYVYLLFIPHPLVFDYSYNQIPVVGLSDFKALLSILIFGALTIFAIIGFRKKDPVAFGILFFLASVSLVSNILFLIESTMAERFLYMPSLGFCLAITITLARIFKLETNITEVNFPGLFKKNTLLFTLTGVLLLLFSFKTISRNFDWKDNLTLLERDVKTSPESARIRYAYGSAILIEQALKEKDKNIKNNLLDKAIVQLTKGVQILNSYSDAFYHLGLAYKEKDDFPNAIKFFEAARQSKTFKEADFYVASGIAYGSAGQYDKAIADLSKAVEISPKSEDAYNNLGLYYNEKNDIPNAIKNLSKAIELKPDFDKAYYNLGNTYAKQGDFNSAIKKYEKAVEINPDYSDAYNNMGNSYAAIKDYPNAIIYYKKVIEKNPQNLQVLNNIGVTYKMLGDNINGDKYLNMVKSVQPH